MHYRHQSHPALDGEHPTLDTTCSDDLSPERALLAAVLAAAVEDCRAVLDLPPGNAASLTEIIKAASAARFFLTWPGQAMLRSLDLGTEAVQLGIALAESTLSRLRIRRESVINGDNASWCEHLEKTYRKVVPKELSEISGRQEAFAWAA